MRPAVALLLASLAVLLAIVCCASAEARELELAVRECDALTRRKWQAPQLLHG